MAFPPPFDPKTGNRWCHRLSREGGYPELLLAQRKDFWVLMTHSKGLRSGFIGEGQYSSPPIGQEPQWQGEMMDYVFNDAEKYIRERDPAFKEDCPPGLVPAA